MAATAVVHENMVATELAGRETFILEFLCTAVTDIPDMGLFVLEIVDPGNPSDDVFTRVANMADFEELSDNRASAILNGDTYFRSDYMRKTYFDLEVATAAKVAVNDRLDTLTKDFDTYYNDFFDNTDHNFPYPPGFGTNIDALTASFYTAYDTYNAAKEAEAEAQTALSDAQALIAPGSVAYQRRAFAESNAVGLATLLNEAIQGQSRFNLFVGPTDGLSNGQWFVDQVDAYLIGTSAPTLQSARDTFYARLSSERTVGGAEYAYASNDHATKKSQADSESALADTDFDTLSNNVATAQSALTAATQAKTDAWTALNTAWASLYAACPGFEASHGYAAPPTP